MSALPPELGVKVILSSDPDPSSRCQLHPGNDVPGAAAAQSPRVPVCAHTLQLTLSRGAGDQGLWQEIRELSVPSSLTQPYHTQNLLLLGNCQPWTFCFAYLLLFSVTYSQAFLELPHYNSIHSSHLHSPSSFPRVLSLPYFVPVTSNSA